MGHFEDSLRDLAQGRLSTADARQLLRQRATFSFHTNPAFVTWHQPLPAEVDVPLTVADVHRALGRYLEGQWSPDDLRDWAEFIVLVDAYSTPEPPVDDEDFYDDLWDILHDLACPEVFGAITSDRVEAMRVRVARYESDTSPPAT